MSTNNNNQPEDNTPTFTAEQEVWIKAIIETGVIHSDGDIGFTVKSASNKNILHYCLSSEIRTTEQIVQEYRDSTPQNTADTPHFTHETPHNAELNDQNAECWVRATCTETTDNSYRVVLADTLTDSIIAYVDPENVRFSEPTHATAVIELIEPDLTRKFKKGDKVRLVERDGRTPIILDTISYKVNNIYEVARDEEDLSECWDGIDLKNPDPNRLDERFLFCHLDLVEPAPEPKYWLHESPKTYSIYYKGQFGRVTTAMLMQKDLYTLEEAQEQCEKLNQKDQTND